MADNKRAPRATETREQESRRKPWAPPSHLEAPAAPEGYVHRWSALMNIQTITFL